MRPASGQAGVATAAPRPYALAVSPRLELVRRPYALPVAPQERFVVLDVAFAGGDGVAKTHAFIAAAGERLRLWVDHHEHPDWSRYEEDPRFVLVPSRVAHACPELLTPEVVARAGEVGAVLAHHDFDGLMAAVRFVLGGREPYEGADEDARAADSPGRGHVLSARGERLAAALGEAQATLPEAEYAALCSAVLEALVGGAEPPGLGERLDHLAFDARTVQTRAKNLAAARRLEAPGVCVVRLSAQLDGRMRREVLRILEEEAAVGLVLEGTPKRYWATAATFREDLHLDQVEQLDRGRHDFRFGPTKDAERLIARLSSLARAAGAAP